MPSLSIDDNNNLYNLLWFSIDQYDWSFVIHFLSCILIQGLEFSFPPQLTNIIETILDEVCAAWKSRNTDFLLKAPYSSKIENIYPRKV